MDRKEIIRTIYLYIFSVIGLVLIVIGFVRLIDLGLKRFVFTGAEQYIFYPSYPAKLTPPEMQSEKTQEPTTEELAKYQEEQKQSEEKNRASQRARTASESIAMIAVGIPLFFYHWKTVQKDRKI